MRLCVIALLVLCAWACRSPLPPPRAGGGSGLGGGPRVAPPPDPGAFVAAGRMYSLTAWNAAPVPVSAAAFVWLLDGGQLNGPAAGARPNSSGDFSIPVTADNGSLLLLEVSDLWPFSSRRLEAQRHATWRHNLVKLPFQPLRGVPNACGGNNTRVMRWASGGCGGVLHHLETDEERAVLPTSLALDSGEVVSPVVTIAPTAAGDHWVGIPRSRFAAIPRVADNNGMLALPTWVWDSVHAFWYAGPPAALVTSDGSPVPEAQWPAIHEGSLAAALMVHFKVVAVVPTVFGGTVPGTCTCGMLHVNGQPAAAHVVAVEGGAWGGPDPTTVTAEDGTFCVNHVASEPPGVDLDGNGVTGEVRPLVLRATSAGGTVRLASVEAPTPQATGVCASLDGVLLGPVEEGAAFVANVTGVVLDPAGAPVPGASVMGRDLGVTPGQYASTCAAGGCTVTATSGQDGAFALAVPSVGRVAVRAQATRQDALGTETLAASAVVTLGVPATLRLEPQTQEVTLLARVEGDTLVWEPPLPFTTLSVQRADGLELWRLDAAHPGVVGPVTLGTALRGTQEANPARDLSQWARVEIRVMGMLPSGALAQASAVVTR